MDIAQPILPAFVAIREAGGRAFFVGGCVRDTFIGRPSKDIDIEVYGLTEEKLTAILSSFGKVDKVGVSFGVLKVASQGEVYDFALARRENKTGVGHKAFEVQLLEGVDNDTFKLGASRRDFTVNALMYDPLTTEVFDFFGGMDHLLRSRALVHVGDAFVEDPLRVLRGMQFAGRFQLTATPETVTLCNTLKSEYSTLAKERLWEEWFKWATKSIKPSLGLQFLVDTGWVDFYPSIKNLIGIPQDAEWHPEGDVFVHTCHVVDYASALAETQGLESWDKAVLVFAALCHDFGKFGTTILREVKGKDRWTAYGHEPASGPLAIQFLQSINAPKDLIDSVIPLVVNHMATSIYKPGGGGSNSSARKLASRLAPSNIYMLTLLCESDVSGRPPLPTGPTPNLIRLLEIAQAESIREKPQKRLVEGRHLIAAGITPGPLVGQLVKEAYQAQEDAVFSDEQGAAEWVTSRVSSLMKG